MINFGLAEVLCTLQPMLERQRGGWGKKWEVNKAAIETYEEKEDMTADSR